MKNSKIPETLVRFENFKSILRRVLDKFVNMRSLKVRSLFPSGNYTREGGTGGKRAFSRPSHLQGKSPGNEVDIKAQCKGMIRSLM